MKRKLIVQNEEFKKFKNEEKVTIKLKKLIKNNSLLSLSKYNLYGRDYLKNSINTLFNLPFQHKDFKDIIRKEVKLMNGLFLEFFNNVYQNHSHYFEDYILFYQIL